MKGILAVEGRLSKSTGRQLDGPSPTFRGRMVTLRQFKNAHQPKDCGSLREGPSGKAGAMVRSGQHDTSTRPRGSWARSPCLLGPVLVRKENKKKVTGKGRARNLYEFQNHLFYSLDHCRKSAGGSPFVGPMAFPLGPNKLKNGRGSPAPREIPTDSLQELPGISCKEGFNPSSLGPVPV